MLLMRGLQDSPVNFAQIKAWTSKDPVLAQVLAFVRTGWPEEEPKAQDGLAPYWVRRAELSTIDAGAFFGVIADALVIGKSSPNDVIKWIQERITCRIPNADQNPELHVWLFHYGEGSMY